MQTRQNKVHHDKTARTKTNTHNNIKTHRTPRRSKHLEKNFICVYQDKLIAKRRITTLVKSLPQIITQSGDVFMKNYTIL